MNKNDKLLTDHKLIQHKLVRDLIKATYRVSQYRSSNDSFVKVVTDCTPYKQAKICCYAQDGWPEFYDTIERSVDGGKTWHEYEASEIINGSPAWAYLLDVDMP